jgi:hypothetical protein
MLLAAIALFTAAQTAQLSVADVLVKADALERKGVFAIFSSDLRGIRAEGQRDLQAFAGDMVNAMQMHRPLPACPPKDGPNSYKFNLNTDDLLQFYRSIPPARRGMSSRQAFAAFMSRKFPCPKP